MFDEFLYMVIGCVIIEEVSLMEYEYVDDIFKVIYFG